MQVCCTLPILCSICPAVDTAAKDRGIHYILHQLNNAAIVLLQQPCLCKHHLCFCAAGLCCSFSVGRTVSTKFWQDDTQHPYIVHMQKPCFSLKVQRRLAQCTLCVKTGYIAQNMQMADTARLSCIKRQLTEASAHVAACVYIRNHVNI